MKTNYRWHILGLLTACLWGSTFVASKVLLNAGLTPAEIMCLRFIIAWVLMLPFCNQHIRTNMRDELLFVVLGMSGGSLYFLAENTAVKISSATSTVALLVCTTPIVTALLNRIVYRSEHLSSRFLIGSFVALIGVSLVVMNGVFVLDDDPMVIILSVGASVMWGIYSLVIRQMEGRYSSAVITRKVFFWGVITMLPICLYDYMQGESSLTITKITEPTVLITLVFLAIIASLICFLVWNIVIRRIGIVTAGNYLYFNPVTSLFVAYIVLDERITSLAILGCILTIAGVFLCNRKNK
ncbi:MAG: DMT family transporter [Bacteroidales bacterium]|nr:DMT family transporter [Bacteroidales bacterium]